VRLLDRMIRRGDYWEGAATGAAVLTTTYGSPNREAVLPQMVGASQDANANSSAVFAAVLVRMALLSEARFQFQRLKDKEMFGDARLAVLENPWPDGSAGALLARMEQDVCLAGNSFTWNAAGSGGDSLVRLRPEWVTIVSALREDSLGRQFRRAVGYWFEPPATALGGSFGDPAFFDVSEVAHWAPVPDPAASFRGMSWLTPIIRDIQGDTGLSSYKVKYLQNNASPNVLIKYAQKLQPGTVDAIRERMQARYAGIDNAFKTLVLDQGADLTVIGNSLEQMNFEAVQQAGAERILAAASVPPVLVGMEPLRGAGRSYVEVVRRFSDLWARPEWRSACEVLEKFTPGADIDSGAVRLWFDTSDIAALQEAGLEKAQIALVHAQSILTMVQAGATLDSAVAAVDAGDVSQLEAAPVPAAQVPQPGQTQHLLPGGGGSSTTAALPDGALSRLPVGTVSGGDGGNHTRPGRRIAAVRRP
jgi:phage portal protein BeeE